MTWISFTTKPAEWHAKFLRASLRGPAPRHAANVQPDRQVRLPRQAGQVCLCGHARVVLIDGHSLQLGDPHGRGRPAVRGRRLQRPLVVCGGKNPWRGALDQCLPEHGVPLSIIRYHNVYGPRMGDKHVIPDFLKGSARVGPSCTGSRIRSLSYIDDARRGHDCVGEVRRHGGSGGQYRQRAGVDHFAIGQHHDATLGCDTDEIVLHPSPAGSVNLPRAFDVANCEN